MRISARIRANRLNAKRSTGPKTHIGKARSAQNAFKHGLSIPVEKLDCYDAEVDIYLQLLIDKKMSCIAYFEAREVAIATVEINRVRRIRHALYISPELKLQNHTRREINKRLNAATKYYDRRYIYSNKHERLIGFKERNEEEHKLFKEMISLKPFPVSLEQGFANHAKHFSQLWRYERRAMARRDKAAHRLRMALNLEKRCLREITC